MKKAIEKAARYVSLIPWVDDSTLFKDMPDLSCTSQEFLDLGMGDSEEHAILLCNYFNYIDSVKGNKANASENAKTNYESYLVYGCAVPQGDCWFVARRDTKAQHLELWDPATGECYSFDSESGPVSGAGGSSSASSANQNKKKDKEAADPICPMKKIWCFVGQENVWANVQEVDAPGRLDYDLDKPALWCPFLDDGLKATYFGGGDVQSQMCQQQELTY